MDSLHIAYSRDKHGCHARGYILRTGFDCKMGFQTGWGETPQEAIDLVKRKAIWQASNNGIAPPSEIVDHGKMPYSRVNGFFF